jgi:hypothetical protein
VSRPDARVHRVLARPDAGPRHAAARPDGPRRAVKRGRVSTPVQPSGDGILKVNVQRGDTMASVPARVLLDGQFLDEAPIPDRKVAAGKHRLEVRRAGFRVDKREINIRPSARTVVNVRLRPE